MHECHNCGQACDCDMDDTWLDAPVECACPCCTGCHAHPCECDFDDEVDVVALWITKGSA